jgi:hypothetical protein
MYFIYNTSIFYPMIATNSMPLPVLFLLVMLFILQHRSSPFSNSQLIKFGSKAVVDAMAVLSVTIENDGEAITSGRQHGYYRLPKAAGKTATSILISTPAFAAA